MSKLNKRDKLQSNMSKICSVRKGSSRDGVCRAKIDGICRSKYKVINYRRGLGRTFPFLYCSDVLNFLKLKINALCFLTENKVLLWEYHAKATIPFK